VLADDTNARIAANKQGGRNNRRTYLTSWGARVAQLPGAAAFLPVGFPDSVRPEYLEYQAWDTIQVFINSSRVNEVVA